MAQGSICIITSSGMICASSPLKQHFPIGRNCKRVTLSGPKRSKVDKIKRFVFTQAGLKRSSGEVIGKVVELLVAMDVDDSTPFTIVKAR